MAGPEAPGHYGATSLASSSIWLRFNSRMWSAVRPPGTVDEEGGGCVDDGLEIRYGWNGPTCDLLSSSSIILLASGKKTATKSKRYKKHLSDALILVLRVVIGNPSMWPMACGQGKGDIAGDYK